MVLIVHSRDLLDHMDLPDLVSYSAARTTEATEHYHVSHDKVS